MEHLKYVNRYKLSNSLDITLDNDNARLLVSKNWLLIDTHKQYLTDCSNNNT